MKLIDYHQLEFKGISMAKSHLKEITFNIVLEQTPETSDFRTLNNVMP